MMLKLYNVRIEPSNVKKLSKPLNVTKELSYVMLELHNMRMKLSNVRKKKGTTKCNKKIVTYDVGIVQYEDELVKCEDLVTWYSRLPISGYYTKKKGVTVDLTLKQITLKRITLFIE